MIIKEISLKSTYKDGTPCYLYRNSKDYKKKDWEQILKYLKINKKANLLNYKIVEV